MPRSCLVLHAIGAVISATAGLLTVENPWLGFGLIFTGLAFIGAACWRSGVFHPLTALTLTVVTNLAFWMSFVLWLARPHIAGPVAETGIDPFSLVVSTWLIVLVGCAIYEGAVLLRGLGNSTQRQISAIGLAVSVLQFVVTIRFAYELIQGV